MRVDHDRPQRVTTPPIGKWTGSIGEPHFAFGSVVESPETAVRRTRACNEWPDSGILSVAKRSRRTSRNVQMQYVCTPLIELPRHQRLPGHS